MTTPTGDGRDDPPQAGDPPTLIWERLERPTRGPQPMLTHDRIAHAAIEIADAEGLEAVTMRRLADRLGVATMGLYRYVAGKDDVFALMINLAYGEIKLPEGTPAGWRSTTNAMARDMRCMYLRHPWLGRLQTASSMFAPNALALTESALASLDSLGLDVDAMMAVFGTVAAFVKGVTANENAQREVLRLHGWSSEDDLRAAYAPYAIRVLSAGGYPTVKRYVFEGSNEDDSDWSFEFGLECILDGIAARLKI